MWGASQKGSEDKRGQSKNKKGPSLFTHNARAIVIDKKTNNNHT